MICDLLLSCLCITELSGQSILPSLFLTSCVLNMAVRLGLVGWCNTYYV